MAINYGKTAGLGAIIGVVTPWALMLVNTVMNLIPGINVELEAVSVSGTVTTGLSTAAEATNRALGLIPMEITIPNVLISAIAGAVFLVLGAYIAEMAGQLKGNKTRRLLASLVTAGILASLMLFLVSGVMPSLMVIVSILVGAVALAYGWSFLDDQLKTNLAP